LNYFLLSKYLLVDTVLTCWRVFSSIFWLSICE